MTLDRSEGVSRGQQLSGRLSETGVVVGDVDVSLRWGVGSKGCFIAAPRRRAGGLACGKRDEERNTQPSLGHQSKQSIMHAQNGSSVGTQRAEALGFGEALKR